MSMRIQGPDMSEVLKHLPDPKKARIAAKSAINDSLRSAKAAAGEEVARDYRTGPKSAFKGSKTNRATNANLIGDVNFNNPPHKLEKWGINPTKRKKIPQKRRKGEPPKPSKFNNPEVTGLVKRTGNAVYKGVFLGKLGNKTNAYVRKGKGRFPIYRVYGPSPSQLVRADRVKERFQERANEVLKKRLAHHINYLMGT